MRSTTTELEIRTPGGAAVRHALDISQDGVRDVIRLAERRDVRSGILILQHLPVTRDGRDLYEPTRAVQTGHWWTIASTAFPTDRIPRSWVSALNAVDEVWVPTSFNRVTFARTGVRRDRIHVVPLRFPLLERPATPGQAYAFETAPAFRFLSVLDLDARKGGKLLLRAFLESFTPTEGAALVLRIRPRKAHHDDDGDAAPAPVDPIATLASWIRELGFDEAAIPEIAVVTESLDDVALADLYAQCHAFVLPSRAESWCQPAFEALAMGIPVIMTRFGGPLEYLHDENAFLVDVADIVDVPADAAVDRPFLRGHRWAEPDLASLRASMRRAFDDRAEAARRARRGALDVAARWTRAHAIARMTARLDAIERAHPAARRPAVPPEPARVSWRAAVYDQSGYASEARAFVKSLHERGFDCKVSPLVWSTRVAALDVEDRILFHRLCELPMAARAISVQHHFPPQFQRDKSTPVCIGRTMFETDRIPAAWVAPCNMMDEIWVPSTQNVESFSASGVAREKLVVVPGTFDFTHYAPEGPGLPDVPDGPFTFLTVFDWHLRKGWDVLLRAYAAAFAGRDDVQLVMKLQLSSGISMDDVRATVRRVMTSALPRGRSAPPVQFIGRLPEAALPALYRSADVFVLPTRGEGYGRPFAEAMAVGVPAIGTRWSGQVDFMDDANSWLIDYRLVPVPEEALREVPTFRGHNWAEPDVEHLRRLMIEAREAPDVVATKGLRAAADVRVKLSSDRVIGIILDRLRKAERHL